MKEEISFTQIWEDDDMVELRVVVCDGASSFCNEIYVAHDLLSQLIRELEEFKSQVYGGIYDIVFGEFGPEYASGALVARLHFHKPGKLYISTHQQSDFEEFSKNHVASEAKMYLNTEPVLLDNFITELKALKSGRDSCAHLECT